MTLASPHKYVYFSYENMCLYTCRCTMHLKAMQGNALNNNAKQL